MNHKFSPIHPKSGRPSLEKLKHVEKKMYVSCSFLSNTSDGLGSLLKLHMARDLLVTTSEKYACHRQIFEYGGIASVSSDESELDSDGGVTIKGYEVIKPVWRSKAFEKLHHDIDDDIKKSRYPTKRNHHHVPGNKPRVRIPSERINMVAIAPPYLPRNCYDESWLTSLRPWELQELSIADWDYDFENRLTGPNV